MGSNVSSFGTHLVLFFRHSSFTDLTIKAGKLLRGYHATCAWTHTDRQDEFDGFPGRRERPKQCLQTAIVTSIPTDLTIRRNHRRRLASSDHISKPATAVEFMQRISNLGNGAERPSIPSKVDLRISKDNADRANCPQSNKTNDQTPDENPINRTESSSNIQNTLTRKQTAKS